MKVKRWSRPAYALFAILFIAVLCFTLLPSPIPFGGAGVASATDTTIQPCTYDNYIDESAKTTNNGASAFFVTYTYTANKIYSLIEFDLSSIPAGATLTSATLNLYYYAYYSTYNVVGRTDTLYRVRRTGADAWSESQSTWNIYKTGSSWGTIGAENTTTDIDTSLSASAVVPASFGWMSWNVLALSNDAISNRSNILDMRLHDAGSAGFYVTYWYSSEYAVDTTKCPKLVIAYTIPAPTIATLAATSITTTSATLNGNVTSLSTYGNVTSYGFVLSTTTVANSPGNVSPSAQTTYTAGNWTYPGVQYAAGTAFNSNGNVTGLTAGTCYYFRAAGYSTYGWVYGSELTFRSVDVGTQISFNSTSVCKWMVPTNVIAVEVLVVAGGGGGGSSSAGQGGAGGGGAGGLIYNASYTLSAGEIADGVTVTIGIGGTGGTPGGSTRGTSGGNSTFGTLVAVGGGGGGEGGNGANKAGAAGGSGGGGGYNAGTGGDADYISPRQGYDGGAAGNPGGGGGGAGAVGTAGSGDQGGNGGVGGNYSAQFGTSVGDPSWVGWFAGGGQGGILTGSQTNSKGGGGEGGLFGGNGGNGDANTGGGGGGAYAYYGGVGTPGNGGSGVVIIKYIYSLPTIATLAATSIATTSVTLNGNVTSLGGYGNVTQYGFVLSTSAQSNPGNVTPSTQSLYTTGNWTYPGVQYPAGTIFTSNGNVTGLSKGTYYYFRAAVYSAYGWVYGNESTFSTLPALITDYLYKKQLFFNTSATGANVAGNQTNFPVAVHINYSSWPDTTENNNFFCAANVGGKYIQFFDSDQTTNLDYEVALYSATGNTSTNEAIYWVRVPSIAGNSTTDSVWIAYGNNPNGGTQNSATGTWDSSYKMVQHMQDPNLIFTNTATYLASGAQTGPVAYHYVGTHDHTYVVWQQQVDTYEWHMWINYYDHDSNTWGTAVDIFHWHSSEIDDNHGQPSVIVDNAGYIHVSGACHNTELMYYRSTSTEDIGDAADHWIDKTANVAIQHGTYSRWIKTLDGTLYLFFRDGVNFSGESRNQSYITTTSTPKGDSWSGASDIVDFSPGSNDDWVYAGNPAYDSINGRIHFGWWWHLTSDGYDTNLYHAYLKLSDGHMYNMAGTDLGTTISQAEADSYCLLIDSRSISRQVRGQTPVCHLDSSGYPYFLYSVTTTGWETGWYYRMMYWTGSAWSSQIEIPVGSYPLITGDFIIHSTTDIEIYLSGTGGAWDRWKWDGSNISKIKTIIPGGVATGTHYWPQVVENYSDELKAVSGSSGVGIGIDSLDQVVPKVGLASPGLLDSTANNNTMTKLSSTQPIEVTGLIGSGQDFDGSNDYGSTGSTGFPSGAATRTVSFWVNMDNVDSDNQVFLVYGTYAFYQDFQIYTGTAASGRNKIVCSIYSYFDVTNPSTGNLTVGTWAYVCVRVTGDKALTLTVNTISNNVTTANSLNTVLSFTYIAHGDIYSGAYSNCKMDEIRVSAGDRGADWTQLEYYSMAKTNFNGDNGVSAPFLSWGAATIDISNTPASKDFGIVQPSQTYWGNNGGTNPITEQLIIGGYNDTLSNSATEYNSLAGGSTWATIAYRDQIISTSVTLSSLYVELSVAPGAGTSYSFTLMKNGVATELAVSISNTSTESYDIVHSVSTVAGDYITLCSTYSGTPSTPVARWSIKSKGATAYESIILSCMATSNSYVEYMPISQGYPGLTNNEYSVSQVIPTNGVLKNLYARFSNGDPGTNPDAYRFTLMKNGSPTTLTTTIIADSISGNDTAHSISVAAGDLVDIKMEYLDTPSAQPVGGLGMTFVSSSFGESLILGQSSGYPSTTDVAFNRLATTLLSTVWGNATTESSFYQGGQSCVLKNLYVKLQIAPNTGNSYTIKVRTGGVNSGLSVTISDAATTGNDTVNTKTLAAFDDLSVSCTPNSEPDSTRVYWGLVCYIAPAEPAFPLTDGSCIGNVTNNSTFSVNILFSMSNLTGGTTWTIGASPASNVFRMRLYISGAGNSTVYAALSATPTDSIHELIAAAHQHYEFVLDTPTNDPFPDGVLKSGNMTLEAEAH